MSRRRVHRGAASRRDDCGEMEQCKSARMVICCKKKVLFNSKFRVASKPLVNLRHYNVGSRSKIHVKLIFFSKP